MLIFVRKKVPTANINCHTEKFIAESKSWYLFFNVHVPEIIAEILVGSNWTSPNQKVISPTSAFFVNLL